MIDTVHVADTTENDLVKMIIGREFVSDDACEGERKHEEVRLEGRNISVGKFGKKLDFRIYKGEILGIFGLVGAGRTELARMIFGIDPMETVFYTRMESRSGSGIPGMPSGRESE